MKSIIAQDLVKTYDKGAVKALDGLSLDVEEGTVYNVVLVADAGLTCPKTFNEVAILHS